MFILAPRSDGMAGPLVDGMVVSGRTLSVLVRQTAVNMCHRHRMENDGLVLELKGRIDGLVLGLKGRIDGLVGGGMKNDGSPGRIDGLGWHGTKGN